jgi:hypothetical protein
VRNTRKLFAAACLGFYKSERIGRDCISAAIVDIIHKSFLIIEVSSYENIRTVLCLKYFKMDLVKPKILLERGG